MAVGVIGLSDAGLGRIGATGIAPLGELVIGVDEPGVGLVAGLVAAGLAVVDGVVGIGFDRGCSDRRAEVGNDGRGYDLGESIQIIVAVLVGAVFGLALDDVGDVVAVDADMLKRVIARIVEF